MVLTGTLVAINAIVFLILFFGGVVDDPLYLYEHGAMYVPAFLEGKEYYRIFTSMFIHSGISHLINNMVTLFLIGRNVEAVVGKMRFVFIYLISGLGGNLLSLVGEILMGEYNVSVGASGAIFGLTGAMLALTIIYRGRVNGITKRDMLIMIGISLYLGFTSENVDNLAHIGGLICGLVVTFLSVGLPKMLSPHSGQIPL